MKTLLSPTELTHLMEQTPVVIIDTRDQETYAAGHIPGAVNIRDIFTYLATTDTDGLDALSGKFAELFGAAGLSGAETAVFYEDSMNTGFGQSCRGYFLLQSLGYKKAAVLHGGLAAWKAEGLPISTEVPVPTAMTFPVNSAPTTLIATEMDMLEAIDDPGIVILDVRDKDEWIGVSSSPYGVDFCPRKGRIPSAVWLEWYNLMDEGADKIAMFRDPASILAACKKIGITQDSTVYVYCFKGARASNTFVALQEAGIKNVKIYFGSWNEWSRDFNLPIDEGVLVAA
ncbi:MAG: sulfurtransferase [Gammaproteobacteria bacterium]|nr:sulfurtransferase [Gammaproteobacteria bacterium]